MRREWLGLTRLARDGGQNSVRKIELELVDRCIGQAVADRFIQWMHDDASRAKAAARASI
jgi:hypothetical protein